MTRDELLDGRVCDPTAPTKKSLGKPSDAAARAVHYYMTQLTEGVGAERTAEFNEPLIACLYEQLREIMEKRSAATQESAAREAHVTSAQSLVQAAYMQLVGAGGERSWSKRVCFFEAGAAAMQRLLVEHARPRGVSRADMPLRRVEFLEIALGLDTPAEEVTAVATMLRQLAVHDPQGARLMALHCFAGLSVERAAELLELPISDAYASWSDARARLCHLLQSDPPVVPRTPK